MLRCVRLVREMVALRGGLWCGSVYVFVICVLYALYHSNC